MICAAAQAQSPTNIRLRLLDGKNGRIILGAGVLLWVNHNATPRGEWVKANEDGTTQIVTPPGVVDLLVHSTYDDATEYYVNCDSPKAMDTPQEMWYKVSDIMSSGVIATDGCIKEKDFEKLKISVKPGELVLFVRKESWKDRAHQMAQ
ncbi:MAG TPA: hypothetical protein VKR52_09800 [Terracidiphilus sp.]|nr:hypothetical protein [Terracidiphilus sp.]